LDDQPLSEWSARGVLRGAELSAEEEYVKLEND